VAIEPSATALTRMPRGPYSTASARVGPSIAALAVAYGKHAGTRGVAVRPGECFGVELDRHHAVVVAEKPLDQRATDAAASSGHDVGAAHAPAA
jgi:hypothetical protein